MSKNWALCLFLLLPGIYALGSARNPFEDNWTSCTTLKVDASFISTPTCIDQKDPPIEVVIYGENHRDEIDNFIKSGKIDAALQGKRYFFLENENQSVGPRNGTSGYGLEDPEVHAISGLIFFRASFGLKSSIEGSPEPELFKQDIENFYGNLMDVLPSLANLDSKELVNSKPKEILDTLVGSKDSTETAVSKLIRSSVNSNPEWTSPTNKAYSQFGKLIQALIIHLANRLSKKYPFVDWENGESSDVVLELRNLIMAKYILNQWCEMKTQHLSKAPWIQVGSAHQPGLSCILKSVLGKDAKIINQSKENYTDSIKAWNSVQESPGWKNVEAYLESLGVDSTKIRFKNLTTMQLVILDKKVINDQVLERLGEIFQKYQSTLRVQMGRSWGGYFFSILPEFYY
jgi:hypothetical protein